MLSDVISDEKKVLMQTALEFCRIVKLVNQINPKKLTPETFLFHYIELERLGYDDYFSALDFFLEHTQIGELEYYFSGNYDGEFLVTMDSLSDLMKILERLPNKQKEIVEQFLDGWLSSSTKAIYINHEAGNASIIGCINLEWLYQDWHSFCLEILELQHFCQQVLKESLNHEG